MFAVVNTLDGSPVTMAMLIRKKADQEANDKNTKAIKLGIKSRYKVVRVYIHSEWTFTHARALGLTLPGSAFRPYSSFSS